MADFAIAFGLIALLAGLVSLARPLTRLGIKSRKAALGVVAAGFAFMLFGAAMLPQTEQTKSSQQVSAVSTTSSAHSTTGTEDTGPFASETSSTGGDAAAPTTAAAQESSPTTVSGAATPTSSTVPAAATTSPSTSLVPTSAVSATVVSVTDGDTIRVSLGGTTQSLRLIGINTPETGECYADKATDRMTELVDGKTVQLVTDVSDRDQYGRLLRYVYVNGVFVNEVMVREGFAIARRYEPDTAMAGLLDAAQGAASEDRLGLWAPDACGPASNATLRIQDLVFDAPGDDSQNLNGEWVTIANTGTSTVDLSGWVLKDESASHRYLFPTGFALLAGETVTVYSGCGTDTSTALYWCTSGSAIWNNSGDTAFLLNPSGNIIDTYAYTGSTTTPTTTSTTSPATTTTAVVSGSVSIATIHYDACGNDVECYNDSEYVELTNTDASDVNLSGWSVTDAKSHTITIPSGYRILAGSRFRIYTGAGDNDPTSRYFAGLSQAIWNNSGGDAATLTDSTDTVVDVYTY